MPAVDERIARSVALEQAYVHDVYEQFYDNPRSKPWPKVQEFLQELEPGSLVCDVGCGNGKYLNVNNLIFNIGGDKSLRLTEVAREKDNEVIVLDNLSLPYRDESLDAVLSIAVVHHLATTERRICALRELARVLRIGGRLIISVWAMEQSHRKFESQDVLVPWHRPKHLSTPSLELTSTTNTSEDDYLPYHAYTQTSDSDSNRSIKRLVKKKGKSRHKGRSIDPGRNSSPSSSSLSSPNETCYSFVRRAIQKLAGGRRVSVHRPWFLDSWTTCAKENQARYDHDGCECCDCNENIHDLPIELRRVDEDVDSLPQRRQTFPSSMLINDIANNLKSKSMTNIKTVENNNVQVVRSQSTSTGSIPEINVVTVSSVPEIKIGKRLMGKPKLVKQKQSICDDEEAEEALDQPTDMKNLVSNIPEMKFQTRYRGVFKQRSLNEELMSTERLQEKERVKRNIQKQASLNDDLIYQRNGAMTSGFDSFKDSFFSSVSTSKRFQLIKTGFTNKLKNSTTIEKVTKNGFVRMFQNWKSSEMISPTIPENETVDMASSQHQYNANKVIACENSAGQSNNNNERRHSKEDGSDSSKDSSLQSDTSVDSEDSFASVIFVPKSDPMSPTPLSPGPISPRLKTSTQQQPRIKQSSCPTSPRIKQMPLTVYPLTKQLSSPKPSTNTAAELIQTHNTSQLATDKSDRDHSKSTIDNKPSPPSLARKYAVPQIPKFRKSSLNSPPTPSATSPPEGGAQPSSEVQRAERLKKIKELLTQKPGFGSRTSSRSNFPIVRHSSVSNGKVEAVAKPLPKLLSLELFNPETDDKDSDSSCVSSPDSVDSVINVRTGEESNKKPKTKFKFPPPQRTESKMSLLAAAADVAQTLDVAVDKVIRSSPKRAKRKLQSADVLSIIQRNYASADTTPLLADDEDCHKHLSEFADKLSEKLLQEIDQYQENSKERTTLMLTSSDSMENIDDPYIHRLSEELDDLSKLSAEIQKQNEYLAKLSASDSLFIKSCGKCSELACKCNLSARTKSVKEVKIGSNHNNNEVKQQKLTAIGGECSTQDEVSNSSSSSDNASKLSVNKPSIRMGNSTDSCDSDKGSSTNSMISSVATSLNFGPSVESTDGQDKDTNSISRYSDGGGSTASLASCPEWKTIKTAMTTTTSSSAAKSMGMGNGGGVSTMSLDSGGAADDALSSSSKRKSTLLSDTSQDSLPSDNIGGEITYHRYYHVFREGELDQLIEKYVENLHIISSYYDHASWCIIAEKVQVWTI